MIDESLFTLFLPLFDVLEEKEEGTVDFTGIFSVVYYFSCTTNCSRNLK